MFHPYTRKQSDDGTGGAAKAAAATVAPIGINGIIDLTSPSPPARTSPLDDMGPQSQGQTNNNRTMKKRPAYQAYKKVQQQKNIQKTMDGKKPSILRQIVPFARA